MTVTIRRNHEEALLSPFNVTPPVVVGRQRCKASAFAKALYVRESWLKGRVRYEGTTRQEGETV